MKLLLIPIILFASYQGSGWIGSVSGHFDGIIPQIIACILGGVVAGLGFVITALIALSYLKSRA